jgi:hypothetical protein
MLTQVIVKNFTPQLYRAEVLKELVGICRYGDFWETDKRMYIMYGIYGSRKLRGRHTGYMVIPTHIPKTHLPMYQVDSLATLSSTVYTPITVKCSVFLLQGTLSMQVIQPWNEQLISSFHKFGNKRHLFRVVTGSMSLLYWWLPHGLSSPHRNIWISFSPQLFVISKLTTRYCSEFKLLNQFNYALLKITCKFTIAKVHVKTSLGIKASMMIYEYP